MGCSYGPIHKVLAIIMLALILLKRDFLSESENHNSERYIALYHKLILMSSKCDTHPTVSSHCSNSWACDISHPSEVGTRLSSQPAFHPKSTFRKNFREPSQL